MTDTEKIATSLLGWVSCNPTQHEEHRGYRWYSHEGLGDFINLAAVTDSDIWAGRAHWPDLNDWNWIRKMEDALAARGLLTEYVTWIDALSDSTDEWRAIEETGAASDRALQWPEYHILRATTALKVAAALKALEDSKP